MEKKELCNIIKDLLPSYVEKLTNEETNKFIESHIKECPECQELLENMKKELEVNSPKEEEHKFKYIKRYSKRLKLLINILLIIALILIIIVSRRFIILTNLINKADKAQTSTNYYIKSESYLNGKIVISEEYNKDKTSLNKLKIYYIDNSSKNIKYITYKNDIDELYLTNNPNQNSKSIMEKELLVSFLNYSLIFKTPFDKLSFSLTNTIQNVTLDGKDCYLIKIQNTEKFIDAETGLVIKFIDNNKNEVIDYHYEFNTVTDQDVARPDTSGYVSID